MTNRQLSRIALLALPAVAGVLASGATATAVPSIAPPVIEEVFSVPGTVSVKFHNPNDIGFCWIFNADTGEIFGGNNPTSFALDHRMVQTSLGNGQLPAGKMRVAGACAPERPTGQGGSAANTEVIEVDVIGKPSTGSFGF
ncbi:hypothetical protein [Nocardia sp. NPDC051832]|uniref:hypothetical protein n=1 Tax=Nocardia sp. NPDC051832 TaxID=3155673 RepID=UPI0034158265